MSVQCSEQLLAPVVANLVGRQNDSLLLETPALISISMLVVL